MFRYGFFNAVDGDRLYNADDISSFFTGLMSDGVCIVPPYSLWVIHEQGTEGFSFTVMPGRAFVQSKYFINTQSYTVTLEAADQSLPRIDRIVLQLDYTERRFNIVVKKGTAAASPVPPSLMRNMQKWELSLARISVPAGATDFSAANLIDERPDKSVCGFASLTAGEIAVYAFLTGDSASSTAIITHSEVTQNANKTIVEIRCDAIADVTPPSSAWAIGSLAWDVGAGKMYGLTSSGWTAQT